MTDDTNSLELTSYEITGHVGVCRHDGQPLVSVSLDEVPAMELDVTNARELCDQIEEWLREIRQVADAVEREQAGVLPS